jgi:flagellar biosynthesis protein FlhF
MTLKTFTAPTMAEALAAVKKEMGKDAVILHTRSFKVGTIFGFGGKPRVEITASVGVNVGRPRRPAQANANNQAPNAAAAPSAPVALASPGPVSGPAVGGGPGSPADSPAGWPVAPASVRAVARAYGSPSPVVNEPNAAPVPSPAARAAVARANAEGSAGLSNDLAQELAAIKCLVGQVLQSSAMVGGGAPGVAMPQALLKYYLRLIQNDVSREIADEVAAAIRDELSPAELSDDGIVRTSVLRRLETLIPTDASIAPPQRGPDGRPQTIALIGPTGVGKTTTLAKLAAAYRLRHGRKVGLITCDTYRIAAVDQLRTYANIIGVPLQVVLTPGEMAAACESLSDCDAILIDTAGRSPGDQERLDELAGFIEAAQPHQIHLVMACVAGEASMVRTVERFGQLRPTRVIFTKLDEAASLGVLLNVVRRLDAKLSFVTHGQEVPDDIEPGRADRLARLILDGATPEAREGLEALAGRSVR